MRVESFETSRPAFIAIVYLFKPRIESEGVWQRGSGSRPASKNQLSLFVWRSSRRSGGAVFTTPNSTVLGKEARGTYVRDRT